MGSTPILSRVQTINRISVAGFKSISREQQIEIRPLTILAGANSSGKSSFMQPMLLLKQTLEASFDPGPLLLIGGHLKFTSNNQVLSRTNRKGSYCKNFKVGIGTPGEFLTISFQETKDNSFSIEKWSLEDNGQTLNVSPKMTLKELLPNLNAFYNALNPQVKGIIRSTQLTPKRWYFDLLFTQSAGVHIGFTLDAPEAVASIIHLPVIRGSSERTNPITAVNRNFVGTFPVYTASILEKWQSSPDSEKLNGLWQDMRILGLTSKVMARRKNGAELEILVARELNRRPRGARDLINLVDVGFGVSQVLPVLVALRTARQGRLVYVEQPENDLHPRAQFALAEVLAGAVKRGVRLVVETHSSLLLLGIQTLVAEGVLDPSLVKLHWFKRDADDGTTAVSSADVDESGAFGEEWPIDFSNVELQAQNRYLNAAELRQDRKDT